MRDFFSFLLKNFIILFIISLIVSVPSYANNKRVRINQIGRNISAEDIKAEIEFGREVAAYIIGKYGLYKNDSATKYVNLLAKSLATASNRPELQFTIGIIDTNTINAFAAPGGYIFITKGVLDTVEDESQLAGIIAHEMIHICQKHIVSELNIHAVESSHVSGFTKLISGTSDPARVAFTKAVDETISILFERGYKKMDEIEADTMGVVLASSLGFDPSGLARYIDNVLKMNNEKTAYYQKLYPPFEDRIRYIEETIDKEGLSTGNFFLGRKKPIEYTYSKN